MWMNRNELRELYPGVTWKCGENDEGGAHYWGVYNSIPTILAFQTKGHDWYEDEDGAQIMDQQSVLWEVSCDGVNHSVVDRNLERALREFQPIWNRHLEAVVRRSQMFLVVPKAEA
jgi:hypothetical protein